MMASPEITRAMVKVLNDMMHSIPQKDYESGYHLNADIANNISHYHNVVAKSDVERQAVEYLNTLRSNVFNEGHQSPQSVSEFMGLIEQLNDEQMKHALLRVATYDFDSGEERLSELEKKLLINRAVGPYSTFDDKVACIRCLYDTNIMESALNIIRKQLQDAFNGKYPDISKIASAQDKAKKLLNACAYTKEFIKTGYVEKIKEEFLDEKAIYAKYDRHNDKLDQPEYMIQDVIPGTEKDIIYDDGRPEQPAPQPEPQQVTIIDLQQEQQKQKIADLQKQIADMQKQINALRKENDDLLHKNQEIATKFERFQQVSEELQQELNAKNKENKELKTEKDQLSNMGKGELFKRFLFGNDKQ